MVASTGWPPRSRSGATPRCRSRQAAARAARGPVWEASRDRSDPGGETLSRPGDSEGRRAHDTGAMGMNPFRPHRRSAGDYVLVVAAFVVVAALVAWAVVG